MGLESTIGVAKTGTNSVRTTVPEGITEFLGVKAGDKLDWKMEVRDNDRVALVSKQHDLNEESRKTVSKHVKPGIVKRP
jgi:hypothetical protein